MPVRSLKTSAALATDFISTKMKLFVLLPDVASFSAMAIMSHYIAGLEGAAISGSKPSLIGTTCARCPFSLSQFKRTCWTPLSISTPLLFSVLSSLLVDLSSFPIAFAFDFTVRSRPSKFASVKGRASVDFCFIKLRPLATPITRGNIG